jgi:L-ascorbate metabolism protein UlaG (beta-lactamase superfamily)
MKITRYAQSCILIETNNKRILIDPGYLQYKESYPSNKWSDIDILLVTHKHSDHCFLEAINEIIKNSKTKLHTTQEVADKLPELSPIIVKANDVLNIDDIKIEVTKAVHGYIPTLRGEKEIHDNVGYIIDDGTTRAYHTGDTICFKNDYKCDIIFVPVVNHGVVMGSWEASMFAKETKAKLVIPFHYDSPKHPANFEQIKKDFNEQELNYKFLEIGESVEI